MDPSNWPKQSIQLAREDNRRQHSGVCVFSPFPHFFAYKQGFWVGIGGGQQAFGEGSEYGQTAREGFLCFIIK